MVEFSTSVPQGADPVAWHGTGKLVGMAGEFSARASSRDGIVAVACVLTLSLPWLWPFTFGPSPNVVPLLVAWGCGLVAVLLAAGSPRPAMLIEQAAPRAWLFAAALSAVIGLLQWFALAPQTVLVSASQLGEAYGNLRQKNQFATLMAIGFAVLLFRPAPALRPAAIGAVLLLAAGSAVSASRTGLLEWLALCVLAVAWPGARRDRLVLCATGLAAYGVVGAVFPHLLSAWRGVDAANVFLRFSTELGCSSRKVLWSNVLHLIAQKPWTGWGVGELDYAHFATLYPGERFCDILDNAHNLPLHVAVELGLPATVAMLLVVGAGVWAGRPWTEADPIRQLAWAVMVVVGLHSLLEYPLWYGPFQLACVLALALLLPRRRLQPIARAAIASACVLALACLLQAAIIYDRVSDAYRPPAQRREALKSDPVGSLGYTVLFMDQVRFAELSVAPVTRANAARVHDLAADMLHYSPEPPVIEKLADSAVILNRPNELAWIVVRYKAAFPDAYARWRESQR
jgi:O-antigen ligase